MRWYCVVAVRLLSLLAQQAEASGVSPHRLKVESGGVEYRSIEVCTLVLQKYAGCRIGFDVAFQPC